MPDSETDHVKLDHIENMYVTLNVYCKSQKSRDKFSMGNIDISAEIVWMFTFSKTNCKVISTHIRKKIEVLATVKKYKVHSKQNYHQI